MSSVWFESIEPEVDPHEDFKHGRYVQWDSRSVKYGVATSRGFLWRKPKPVKSVEWQVRIDALNQGNLGSCTGNAAAHWLATDSHKRRATLYPNQYTAIDIYRRATLIDEFMGAYPPHDTGSSGLAVAKVLKERGHISRYEHAFGLQQVKVALQTRACLVGMRWRKEMYWPGHGWVRYQGSVVGGHEVLLIGWRAASGNTPAYFTFRNSWGPRWGNNGNFIMSESDFGRVLREGGDVIAPVWK